MIAASEKPPVLPKPEKNGISLHAFSGNLSAIYSPPQLFVPAVSLKALRATDSTSKKQHQKYKRRRRR
jgi:hypothetical protein